jgi:hypothetical protein
METIEKVEYLPVFAGNLLDCSIEGEARAVAFHRLPAAG